MSGPVQVSYPEFNYKTAQLWTPTMANLSLKTTDPQGGEGWGGFLTPNSIDPRNGTRSYAKTAYLDPVADRENLNVLTDHQVIKIEFDTSSAIPRATGVQFQNTPNGTVYKTYARHEVILSAGVFGTPQLLELSGVGAKGILDSKGITQIANVPGVGEHFQDHVLVPVVWTAPNDTETGDLLVQDPNFKQAQIALFKAGNLTSSLVAAPNNGIAYVNLRQLFNEEEANKFMTELKANMTTVINNQVFPDDTVKAGYNATYSIEADGIIDSNVGVVELLLGSFGSWNPINRTVSIQVAIQHPMSRGSVHINTTNAWDAPIITANYLNTDSDWQILRAGVKCEWPHPSDCGHHSPRYRLEKARDHATPFSAVGRGNATRPRSPERCRYRQLHLVNGRVSAFQSTLPVGPLTIFLVLNTTLRRPLPCCRSTRAESSDRISRSTMLKASGLLMRPVR
jgi:choline dehydrogenase